MNPHAEALRMKAPFPYFGGKSKVVDIVWACLGDVSNYVEPFAGSLAVLLSRPHKPKTETVNDIDCYLSNFWRALSNNPEAVAEAADWPVNEADLLARHKWLIKQTEFQHKMKTDPFFYDVKIAGWWVWGVCSWIGSGWCVKQANQLPHLGNAGMGINRKLPHLGDAEMGIKEYFYELSNRLRKVRVACGDWTRVMGESVTIKHGITGVFLDPPYAMSDKKFYSNASTNCCDAVREWAILNGDNPNYRIVLCGYAGDYIMPENWTMKSWKASGGYGSQSEGQGRENAKKERMWFSSHCLKKAFQMELYQ